MLSRKLCLLAGAASLTLASAGWGLLGNHSTESTVMTNTTDDHADDGLNQAVLNLYAVISGPAGQARDWDEFRGMFTEDAVMGQCLKQPNGNVVYQGFTPKDYVERSGPWLEENGFFEIETDREVKRFGQMAHVWTTYEARRTAEGEVFMRGINSVQMVNMGEAGWKIRSIFWNPETPENPLPAAEHQGEHGNEHEGEHDG